MTTNYQRTANWLAACGKKPGDAKDASVQAGCHIEEIREQLELMRVSQDGWAAVLERIVIDLRYLSEAIKSGKIIAHIPQHLRADFLKEVCDGEVTGNGLAYMLAMDKETADQRVLDANDSKFNDDGTPVILPGGKIGKSKNYKKADVKDLV